MLTSTSGSLFYQRKDGGYWDLQENIHIFGHPTLEVLTIRRAKLDMQGFESLEKPEMTPLKELHLVECDINEDGLTDLLGFPEALKEISLTQLEVPFPPLEESPEDIEDFILAMQPVQHSLETISIDFATLGSENPLKLRGFDALTSLELRDYQLYGQSGPRLTTVGLPPNLEILTFLNTAAQEEEFEELLCYTIENKEIFARKLSQIVLVEGEAGLPPKFVDLCTKAGISIGVTISEPDD
jgi:hypothetical protein